jgi:N6-L-threonylcarbamoyladenine synthase
VNQSRFKFPRPRLSDPDFDFSFSGLKTSVFYQIRDLTAKKPLTALLKNEIAYAFQDAVCDCLVEKTMRAVKACQTPLLVVGGGVSANAELRKRMQARGQKEGVEVIFPSFELCVDNAVMIAFYGQMLAEKQKALLAGKRGLKRALAYEVYSEFALTPSGSFS